MIVNERVYRDEDGRKITNHTVYKDLMIFFTLLEKDIFGGRVMFTKPIAKDDKLTDSCHTLSSCCQEDTSDNVDLDRSNLMNIHNNYADASFVNNYGSDQENPYA